MPEISEYVAAIKAMTNLYTSMAAYGHVNRIDTIPFVANRHDYGMSIDLSYASRTNKLAGVYETEMKKLLARCLEDIEQIRIKALAELGEGLASQLAKNNMEKAHG